MADNRTMAQMLQAPIEGYEDAIGRQTLIKPPSDFPTRSTYKRFRHPEVPNTSIKLLLFPFSLDGEARDWLDKEPPRSILTWDDLVSKFINQFFPPSKTTYLRNEITSFYQKPNETFNEAWERFKGLFPQCPHHGFSELHQLDTFYNSLNTNDQDVLDSAASRAIEPRASTNAPLSTSTPSNSFEFQQLAASLEDKMDIRMSRLEKMISEKNVTTPATVKAVEENSIGTSAFKQIPELALIFLPHIIYKKLLGLEAFDFPTNSNDTSSLPIVHYSHPMGIVEDGVIDNLETFTDDLTPLNSLPPGDDVSILKKDSQEGNFQVHSNPLFEFDDNFKSSTINPLFDEMEENVEIENSNEPVLLQIPLSDKGECFYPRDDIDEIDVFLAMEISMDYEKGYYDSEGDVLFLESLLCEDTTYNFASEVISDHDTLISFSSRSDPLHHEFAGELLTLPSRNDREHEDYLNHDLIPPGVENDDSEDEDNEFPNFDHQDDPSIPRPPPELPDVEKSLKLEAGI
ncbi:reverse transcriptase domain-containing protein [Tanacetum coccineum]